MMEADDPRHHAVPLCDVLRAVADRKTNICYIADSMFPLELTELILHFLEYNKGVPRDVLEDFRKRYITMDTLCPIGKLLNLWGLDKFNMMIRELEVMAEAE